MKFKAQLQHNNILMRVLQSLEKLGKLAVMTLAQDHIKFIFLGESDGGFQLFAPIYIESVFMDVTVSSANEDIIHLEFSIESLLRAIRSTVGSESVQIRLIKKHCGNIGGNGGGSGANGGGGGVPVLTFVISNYTRNGRPLLITQDVPVRILTPLQMKYVKEPSLPTAQVCIMMPNINVIRSVAEKMKRLNNKGYVVEISANNGGCFVLKSVSEVVEIETFFRGLENPKLPERDEFESETEYSEHLTRHFSCKISMKNFIKFLYSHYTIPTRIVCVIIENHAVIFTVYIGTTSIGSHFEDGSNACGALTYYIPGYK